MLRVRHLGVLEVGGRRPDNPRERRLAQIVDHLHRHGPSSRASIAEHSGLGISTLSELIGELRGRGLVTESEPVHTRTVGRPLRMVRLDGEDYLVAGLEIDDARIGGRLETLGGRELHRVTRPWRPYRDSPADVLAVLVDDLLGARAATDRSALLAVEVGVPGVVRRPTGEVVHSWPLALHERPLGEELLDRLAGRGYERTGVGIENDCNLAALAASAGADGPADGQVSIYIGGEVSVGGTVLIGDRLLRGSGGAGELGHYVVDPHGRRCWCGRIGCLSTVASLRLLLASTGLGPDEVERLALTARDEALARVVDQADAGDPRVEAALQTAADGLKSLLHGMRAVLDPELVLIGGFLGALGGHLDRRLADLWPAGATPDAGHPPRVRLLVEPDPSVVDGALISARTLCLRHPLHFSRTRALPL